MEEQQLKLPVIMQHPLRIPLNECKPLNHKLNQPISKMKDSTTSEGPAPDLCIHRTRKYSYSTVFFLNYEFIYFLYFPKRAPHIIMQFLDARMYGNFDGLVLLPPKILRKKTKYRSPVAFA